MYIKDAKILNKAGVDTQSVDFAEYTDLHKMTKKPELTTTETNRLIEEYQKTHKTKYRNEVVYDNARLALAFAYKFKRMPGNAKLSVSDLYSVGIIGLIRAVETFDTTKNTKYITYACYWVQQMIQRYIIHNYNIAYLPVHVVEFVQKIKVVCMHLEVNNIAVTPKNVAHELAIDEHLVEEVWCWLTGELSLDAEIGINNDEEYTLGAVIADPDVNVVETVERSENAEQVLRIMKRVLTVREYQVMLKRFGFENGSVQTLDQIGRTYNLTRERIRQIEERALRKLKNTKAIQQLYNTYGG